MESESKNEMFILGAAGLGILAWAIYRFGGKAGNASMPSKPEPASKPVQVPEPVKNNQNKTEDEIENFERKTKTPENVAPPKQTGNGVITNQEKNNEPPPPSSIPSEAPPSTSTSARNSAFKSFVVGASVIGGTAVGLSAIKKMNAREGTGEVESAENPLHSEMAVNNREEIVILKKESTK